MRKRVVITAASLCILLVAGLARAQTTGSISGVVLDQTGLPVPGVSVKASGDALPAGRTVTSGETGAFNFPLLLPGVYQVEASKEGLTGNRRVVVEVDKDSQTDVVLGATLQEELTVTAAIPVVDMKSTEVAFNYATKEIESLPLERSYRGLFQLIPGVADPSSSGGTGIAPAAGGSRQDNMFLVDGVNVTNPGYGYLSSEINELDLQEFNVKRGAITAEFGRASGFVTNAVTRSGTNDLHVSARFELQPKQFNAGLDDPVNREKQNRFVPAFAAGGPVVRDRLFWYASGRFARSSVTDRVNTLGPIRDSESAANEVLVKLTGQLSSSHALNASFRHRPNDTEWASIGLRDAEAVATHFDGKAQLANVSWNWFVSSATVLDVRYLHLTEGNDSVAVTDLGFQPAWNPNDLARMGMYDDGTSVVGGNYLRSDRIDYTRNEVKATLTHFLDLKGTSHQIKAGFGWDDTLEDLTRKSNGWGSIVPISGGSQVRARYYPDQPSQKSRGTTYSLFVQDDITLTKRLVVNAGLLFNRDEFAQEAPIEAQFLTFNLGDEIQPRVGANFNLRPEVGDKIYANYGRYYNLDQKSSARSLAPGRLFTRDAIFDAATGALISDTPGANTTGKVLDPDMKPTYGDEFLVGYATPIAGAWSLDSFFMYRTTKQFIEDQPRVPPASSFWYTNLADAERTYHAFTIELSRRLANRWSMTASYGWSRLHGNFDLDYDSGSQVRQTTIFNTSSFIQDGPGIFVQDRFRKGPLAQDRPHVFKLFASYEPVDNLTIGGYLRAQSGLPWAAKGRDWYDGFNRYLEPAGSRRNDTWTNVDLLASYRWRVATRTSVTMEARVLNLFNTQTALFRDQRQYLDGRIRSFSGTPDPNNLASYTDLMIQGTTQPNPRFGAPTDYAQPTRFVLTFVVNY